MKITKDMRIGDIIKYHPEVVRTLMEMQMGCIGCPSAQLETLEEAAAVHGKDIDEMVRILNEAASE